ncbi:MAG: type II secretion system protein [Candidatus Omnitrophota bacterium]
MFKILKKNKGFTLIELMFVALLSLLVIGAIVSSWVLASGTWSGERERTHLRVDLMKALETIKHDLRLSDLNEVAYYPEGGGPYTAISIPVAETDANGFFTLDAEDNIEWDKTVIYHIYTDAGGDNTLRRTVFDPRDNTMTDTERYTQLENVVTTGLGTGSYTTDTGFLQNLDTFEISSHATVIDFYTDSSTPVKSDKVVFGWASFDDGDHVIRFEITGKNDSSSDYDIGVDSIMIEPAGSSRELEYYNSAGILTVSGGTANRVYDPIWSNDNYLDFDSSSGVGDYIEFTDHYDLWRESSFENVALENTVTTGEEVRIAIDIPGEDEEGEIVWIAPQQVGDPLSDGHDGSLPWGSVGQGVTVRALVASDDISSDGDLARVRFRTYQGAPLLIERAYITRKDATSSNDYDGYANQSPAGLTIEEYHRHQQLFFKDTYDYDTDSDTDEITPRAWIPATSGDSSEMWSLWTAYPLVKELDGSAVDYFVTFFVSDPTAADAKYWQGTSDVAYYLTGDSYSLAQLEQAAGMPDWGGNGFTPDGTSMRIYATTSIDSANTSGNVISQIFDTTLSTPDYDSIVCAQYTTATSSVVLKGRSSTSETMSGAPDWDLVGSSIINGNNRYVQFLAELSAEPAWETSTGTLVYEDYIFSQLSDGNDYTFPEAGGIPYITEVTSPEIDDVTIDWHPDTERICAITGYIARKNDYGQAKITVDGEDIVKVLSVHVKVTKEIQGRDITGENYADVYPRNTGR